MQGLRRFQLGEREVDLDRGTVSQPGGPAVALTPNEVRLLQVLVEHAGAPVDRDRLLMDGLGYRRAVTTRAIDQAIWRLRRKLEDEGHEPRYLHSDPSVGYRLELSHKPVSPQLVGRDAELAQLLTWVDAGAAEIWLVGAPGSGRSALLQALAHARPDMNARCHRTHQMPEGTGRVLRLGGLTAGAGRELLVRTAMATRGLAQIPAQELPSLHALADRVDHHPMSLVNLGHRTLLEPASEIQPSAEPALIDFLQRSPPELVQAMQEASVFPDVLTGDDVELELLVAAWRASLCESVGPGRFLLASPLRQALAARGSPSDRAWAGFVSRVRAQLDPLVQESYTTGQDLAQRQLVEQQARLERALLREPPDETLLLAWLVTGSTAETLRAFHASGPDARVALALQRSEALEVADPEGASWELDAAADLSVDDRIGLRLHRTRVQLALRRGVQLDVLAPLLSQAEEVAQRLDTPYSRIHLHQTRGIVALRRGRWEDARGELITALGLCRTAGTRWLSTNILQNLAALAYRDGRIYEAIAWTNEALDARAVSAEMEGRFRVTLATLLLGAGELEEARRQLELAEMLGADERGLFALYITVELLEDKPERALVRLATSRSGVASEGDLRAWLFLSAWAGLILADLPQARRMIEQIASDCPPAQVRDEEMLALVRAALAACEGDPEGARQEMARIPADSSQKWETACHWLEALLRATSGARVDVRELEQRMRTLGVGDIALRLGLRLLERMG